MHLPELDKYPKLASFIAGQMPAVYFSEKICKNIKNYGSLDKTKFRHALVWGTYPTVVVRPLDNNYCTVERALGCYDGDANENEIMLDKSLVEAFEKNPNDSSVRFLTKKGVSLPIVGGVLLHELCHWGNRIASRSEAGRELGEEFEKATYGVKIVRGVSFEEESI